MGLCRCARLPVVVSASVLVVSCGLLPAAEDRAPEDVVAEARPVPAGFGEFLESIPDADVPRLDHEMALALVAMPLACLDRPHAAPRARSTYLDEFAAERRPGYERNRAFYGCWDWHSAVNATWAMVRIHKEYPQIPVSGLIREKLNHHLSQTALAGEIEFFEESRTFERPYGWAWLLKLYAELRTWDHPEAAEWADNVEPLAKIFSERTVLWLRGLERPSRSGAHSNTAFALAMMLDYARTLDDTELEAAVDQASRRLFLDDFSCPTAYEPWGSDFLSPCLEEAKLMASVLEAEEFADWFERFMPPVESREFQPLTRPIDMSDKAAEGAEGAEPAAEAPESAGEAEATESSEAEEQEAVGEGEEPAEDEQNQSEEQRASEALQSLASRSHLIGLAFVRADAMNEIAAALPSGDARADAYRKLAALHGEMGFEAMFDADYAGSHWIGTFALKYLMSEPR